MYVNKNKKGQQNKKKAHLFILSQFYLKRGQFPKLKHFFEVLQASEWEGPLCNSTPQTLCGFACRKVCIFEAFLLQIAAGNFEIPCGISWYA